MVARSPAPRLTDIIEASAMVRAALECQHVAPLGTGFAPAGGIGAGLSSRDRARAGGGAGGFAGGVMRASGSRLCVFHH